MPKKSWIKKVLVIGSGPIVIGQAAEFDYAGTQACRVLKEEGLQVVLVNSNPATIMTDANVADRVYLEPLNAESVESIIAKERPDSLLPTLGGQTGLNLAMELYEKGILDKYNVQLLGTKPHSIKESEDREAFANMMQRIGEPIIRGEICLDVKTALSFAAREGYPVIVRPAYTLGGTGGGIAVNELELSRIAAEGLRASRVHQILVEVSVAGWKEVEYEVMRDAKGNCITVCNMENFDPVGVHTGDSIVVAPSQTLRDAEYQMLRSASLNIINSLEIEGGCNVQFALSVDSLQYYVIEVNPRVSRSSALASKATGYPIAKVSTRIAIGYGLDEIDNGVTGRTKACFEPTLDYCVVKFPRWPFDKFTKADKHIGTKMKATGEVMSIGTNFEAALLKAVRSLELGFYSLDTAREPLSREVLREKLYDINTERLFTVADALRKGISQADIYAITKIDPWFLDTIDNIVQQEELLKTKSLQTLEEPLLRKVKNMGFADKAIASFVRATEAEIRQKRIGLGILPAFRMVDTCAAEFDAVSPYYYSAYGCNSEHGQPGNKTVVVLGSGPIRIGQGIEFDYCSVHCVWALKRAGFDTVIINNNPETVSTDFDTSDRLYFEPLTPEDVINILDIEKPYGVFVQFGGQTAIKLAAHVERAGYKILGTSVGDINAAEDREVFDKLLEDLQIARPQGGTVFTADEAVRTAEKLGYPVLVRPSYVLGGQGMQIAYEEASIREYMRIINLTTQEHPVLVDKYILGTEVEVDAICDGEEILIPGIMEHVERAGIHSGDSISVYPAQNLTKDMEREIILRSEQLAKGLHVKGLVNIQYIVRDNKLYVIEVNPRSSRTIPYISKVTGLPVVELGVRTSLGEKLGSLGYGTGLFPNANIVAVKHPIFSFEKLPGVEVGLGPEMKSTGEVLGIGYDLITALRKSFVAANIRPQKGGVFLTVTNPDKPEAAKLAVGLQKLGFSLYATKGTAAYLAGQGIQSTTVERLSASTEIRQKILDGTFRLILSTPSKGNQPERDGFAIRRLAVECGVPCMTSLDTAKALLACMEQENEALEPLALQDIQFGRV